MSSQIIHPARQPQRLDFPIYHDFHRRQSHLPDVDDMRDPPFYDPLSQHDTTSLPVHKNVVRRHSSLATTHRTAQGYLMGSEHMLRRKTPNGTLAAAYDGNSLEWSNRPSASKMQRLQPIDSQCPNGRSSHYPAVLSRAMGNKAGDFTQLPSLHSGNGIVSDHISMGQSPIYHPFNGMQVPTVLQPNYQAVGPTASNSATNLYGPYWPDGRREPYRPAAVRGYGYHNYGSSATFPERFASAPSMQVYQHAGSIEHNTMPFDHCSVVGERRYQGNHGTHLGRYRPETTQLAPVPLTMSRDDGFLSTLGSANEISSGNQNVQFKDRALRRSQKAYVDLLAVLHRSGKDSSLGRRSHTRSFSQPTMYPKLPRQNAQLNRSSLTLHPPLTNSHCNEAGASARDHSLVYGRVITRCQPRTLVNNLYEKISSIAPAAPQEPHDLQSQPPVAVFKDEYLTPVASTADVFQNAETALEMLTSLCQESEGSWIDGMLLAGCLAYGLKHFNIAVFWYSNILERDPSHVEALSNLAASLLALNRREEAEQHWLRSVKLRPGYFEAVEHLIGLLCEDHRGSEAISIIDFVERSLRITRPDNDRSSDTSSDGGSSSASSTCVSSLERPAFDFDGDMISRKLSIIGDTEELTLQPGFGSSGYAIAGIENGRMLALVHAKGNLLYALGDAHGASRAFEDAVLISSGRKFHGIQDLIRMILRVLSSNSNSDSTIVPNRSAPSQTYALETTPLLLPPDEALKTASLVFAHEGELPGIRHVAEGLPKKAAISTMSNSLLSLAKIYQDGLSSTPQSARSPERPFGVDDILALYYLSLSLQPSPSTANNVGILLASVQQPASSQRLQTRSDPSVPYIPGVMPGSGVALALAYYNYGLNLDPRHAHLFTNLGSLLKDIGQLTAAIKMYEQAVTCDGKFDIALANLANAVKDQGRIGDAIEYYRRAVASSPDFAEAVCGLSNALNSVCDWNGRGGVILAGGRYDRWHVDDDGMLSDAKGRASTSGWMARVVDIVGKQLTEGAHWGRGVLQEQVIHSMLLQLEMADSGGRWSRQRFLGMEMRLKSWSGTAWEGARVVQLVERAVKVAMRRWYWDKFIHQRHFPQSTYLRPALPGALSVPSAPTVLPFHTFTCPLTAKDIRMISQRNALRISCSTLRFQWLPNIVYPPPPPPRSYLNIGYVSSDFNNHPLAHLMQSVFGLHDPSKAKAFCYATTPSDHSTHRLQIEREAPVFRDSSTWSSERLVQQIVKDEIHVLVNLNGYTRGAKNEIFAARPAPIQMSLMGFAGSLGAEWCDYLLADEIAVPRETLRPGRRNINLEDQLSNEQSAKEEHWVYSENIIFCRDTFFCCDHRQSSQDAQLTWPEEQQRRWKMRKELFPSLSDDFIILGNFNQLYKIEPTTFRTWLRILSKVPKAILWLLRFPDLGEQNLRRTAKLWAGEDVASRIWFTDVAPKGQHISRARVCDLFLDTAECNAHTTAADVLWSSTPLLTLPKYNYKMCSRMAASILTGALPKSPEGKAAAKELIAEDEDQYESFAVRLASGLSYDDTGAGLGRLAEIRKVLYESRWTSALFDTGRWVRDVEEAYHEAWRRWVDGIGGDIYL